MENETEKLIQDQLMELPESLRKAIEAVPWKSLVNQIVSLHNLAPIQTEAIERESMFIVYSFENSEDYIGNMVKEANIDESLATTIAEEVNEKVFKVIAEKIDEISKPEIQTTRTSTSVAHPENLPMIEEGEVAHEVPHQETTTDNQQPTKAGSQQPTSNPQLANNEKVVIEEKPKQEANVTETPMQKTPSSPHYPGGVDPYREPIQ